MIDVHRPEVRSYNMSMIKSKDTKPELLVRRFLHLNGFRFRLHANALPGRPDIVLKKYNTVIFVHGCFWHGHGGCKYFVTPQSRTEWWMKKISKNKLNDRSKFKALQQLGWKIVTVWECQLRSKKRERTLANLLRGIN
jgi:DNA mismatch endonuclease (patch repair protein)